MVRNALLEIAFSVLGPDFDHLGGGFGVLGWVFAVVTRGLI